MSNTTDPPHRADLNGDGVINISDFGLLAAASGQSIAAVDPTVMHPRVGAGSAAQFIVDRPCRFAR